MSNDKSSTIKRGIYLQPGEQLDISTFRRPDGSGTVFSGRALQSGASMHSWSA